MVIPCATAWASASAARSEHSPLGLGEAVGVTHDGVEIVTTTEQAEGDHAQHGADGVLAVSLARIGHGSQGLRQGLELGGGDGQRCSFAGGFPCGMGWIKLPGIEPFAAVWPQRFDPELLGPFVRNIELSTLAAVALGEAERGPACGFIAGASVALDVGESLTEQGLVAKVLVPVLGQRTHGMGQCFAGEIGPPGGFGNDKAHVVDDEVAPPRTGLRIPADPRFAVFEVVGTRRPLNGGDGLAILTDEVHQAVADGAKFSERMFFLQPFIGNGLVFRANSDGYGEVTEPRPCGGIEIVGGSSGRYHGTLTSLSKRELSSNII